MNMPAVRPIFLSRCIAAALFTALIALLWDGWWHVAVGRDTFWEPPHFLLYSAVAAAILMGWYGYTRLREVLWRRLALILLLVPLSAPFDEWWHRMFGVENLSTPLIVWSPPHLVLFGSLVASAALLLPILRRDSISAQRLFGLLCLALILTVVVGVAFPFYPLGPYHVLGFWGAGIIAALFVFIFMYSHRWVPEMGGATLVSMIFVGLYFIQEVPVPASRVLIPPYAHPPGWIIAFSTIIPALLIDLFEDHFAPLLRGALAGLAYTGIVYGLTSHFVDPAFAYSNQDLFVAVIMSVVGGGVGGWIAGRMQRNRQAVQGTTV